jgi:ArsR family transcriptional regulator, arsenate/arsenite/antimonite-responsive transcriptional repressor
MDGRGRRYISKHFYIDRYRCSSHACGVSKNLALVKSPKQTPTCCAPKGKLRAPAIASYAALFKALGDETRLGILAFLAASDEATCACHIEDYVKELSQPTISHHLRLLREAGLVTAERRGTWVYYAVDKSVRERLSDFMAFFTH